MKTLKVTLQTVTPMFLGGADPRGEPELRAASVRGALRFWLRALLGGALGDRNLDALRRAENEVFGSTDTGASPVVVRLKELSGSSTLTKASFSALAEWDGKSRVYRKPGIAYLFFAARGTRRESERKAIQGKFQLILNARPGAQAEEAFKRAYAALWLLTRLGGLGARSRRGAGSLQVVQVKGDVPSGLPALPIRATSPEELQEELAKGLRALRQLVGDAGNVSNPSAFDVLHPNACKIWIINKIFSSWEEALDKFGQSMQQFRNRRDPDYSNVKSAMQGGKLTQPVERAAFGLPIVFYYRSLGGQSATLEGETHERRASPLMIRVTRLSTGKYVIVLTLFQAVLLPDGSLELIKKVGGRKSLGQCSIPGMGLVDNFLNNVDTQVAPRLEVTGW